MAQKPGEMTTRAVRFVTGCSIDFGQQATKSLRQKSRIIPKYGAA